MSFTSSQQPFHEIDSHFLLRPFDNEVKKSPWMISGALMPLEIFWLLPSAAIRNAAVLATGGTLYRRRVEP